MIVHRDKQKKEFIVIEGKNRYSGDVIYNTSDLNSLIAFLTSKFL